MAIAVIVVNQRSDRLENIRVAITSISLFPLSTPDVVEVPIQIAKHLEIKQAIAVQINPTRAGRPSTPAHTGLFSHIGKRPPTMVLIELLASTGRYVLIFD